MAFLVLFSVMGKEDALHLCVRIRRNTVQETAPSFSIKNLGLNSSCALLRQRNPGLKAQPAKQRSPSPRPTHTHAAPRLLRCPPQLRLHLLPLPAAGSSRSADHAGAGERCRIFSWSPVNPVSPIPGPRVFLRSGRQLRRPFTGSTVSLSVYSFPMAIAPPSLSASGTWPGAVLVTLKFLLQRCQI